MSQELSAEKIKAFCEAWGIEPETKEYYVESSAGHRYYGASDPMTLAQAQEFLPKVSACNKAYGWTYEIKSEVSYPPLTLELLLGVLAKENIDARIDWLEIEKGHEAVVWVFTGMREECEREDDATLALIKAMAAFKNVEV